MAAAPVCSLAATETQSRFSALLLFVIASLRSLFCNSVTAIALSGLWLSRNQALFPEEQKGKANDAAAVWQTWNDFTLGVSVCVCVCEVCACACSAKTLACQTCKRQETQHCVNCETRRRTNNRVIHQNPFSPLSLNK